MSMLDMRFSFRDMTFQEMTERRFAGTKAAPWRGLQLDSLNLAAIPGKSYEQDVAPGTAHQRGTRVPRLHAPISHPAGDVPVAERDIIRSGADDVARSDRGGPRLRRNWNVPDVVAVTRDDVALSPARPGRSARQRPEARPVLADASCPQCQLPRDDGDQLTVGGCHHSR